MAEQDLNAIAFPKLDDEQIAKLGRYAGAPPKKFRAGEALFRYGDRDANFFIIKSGEIDLHMRAPIGTRIEEAGKIAVLVEQQIRNLLPGHVVGTLVNCGLPNSGINLAYSSTGTVGAQDCDITISLDNQAAPVDSYRRILRGGLTERFPGTDFSFLPGDITAKILNFGLPSPIDVQVGGRDLNTNFAYATLVGAWGATLRTSASNRDQSYSDIATRTA